MAAAGQPRPLRILIRDLIVTLVVGGALFALFDLINRHAIVLTGFGGANLLLLEAGAILLVGYLFTRAVTGAATAVMQLRGDVSRSHVVRIFLTLLIAAGVVFALFTIAGVSIESIFLGSALAGIVLGLAAQTVLANLFAGLLLVFADPFRVGDRINIVSSSLGAIAPSYPHEMMYPLYGGIVEDVGLTYTVLRQDDGGTLQVPNSVVLSGLVQHPEGQGLRTVRVRMTFPQTIPVAAVEAAVADLRTVVALPPPGVARVSFEVIDVSATSWDGVVTVVTSNLKDTMIRDRVLRSVLSRVAAPAPTPPAAKPGPTS